MIVLPSDFTGGGMQLSHEGVSAMIDASCPLSTTALAWYHSVTQEIAVVTSGVQVILVYDLIRNADASLPRLTGMQDTFLKLDAAFSSWGSSIHSGPKTIAHLLDYTYSNGGAKMEALQGNDHLKVQALAPISQQHGFRLGLGTFVHHLVQGNAAHGTPKIFAITDLDGRSLGGREFTLSDGSPDGRNLGLDYLTEAVLEGPPLRKGKRKQVSPFGTAPVRSLISRSPSLTSYVSVNAITSLCLWRLILHCF